MRPKCLDAAAPGRQILESIVADIDPGNEGSMKVARKTGMVGVGAGEHDGATVQVVCHDEAGL